ncbi:MAG: Rid family hydrolase, partial [Petrimonas sp.]|nr:Rid family hydrolase [Petrimonas sp.]
TTHYIASTGIAGRHSTPQTILTFDAYAVEGLRQEQIQFLYAPDHLSRTSDYGVTFERGVCLHFEHKKQVFISGTASIDKTGHVVHEGDVIKQADRMIENVSELLKEADMDFSHMAQIIVYLRDIADYDVISAKMEKEFPQVPKIIVFAPICRPAWLVEMECIALK